MESVLGDAHVSVINSLHQLPLLCGQRAPKWRNQEGDAPRLHGDRSSCAWDPPRLGPRFQTRSRWQVLGVRT